MANDAAGSVLQIDPETDEVKTYRLGHFLTGIGASGHVVAVSVRPTGADVLGGVRERFSSIRMGHDWIGSADPAVGAAPGTNEWPWLQQLFHATCAGLLSYPDAAGQRGRRLVPEVAAALPSVSRDGRTYTFAVRRGFRFSPPSNQPVTAETFKYSIERALSPKLGIERARSHRRLRYRRRPRDTEPGERSTSLVSPCTGTSYASRSDTPWPTSPSASRSRISAQCQSGRPQFPTGFKTHRCPPPALTTSAASAATSPS